MLDILMSVHGEWIAKMVSGEKTGELRKTWPKNIPTPFRVRLYCTQVRREEVLLLDGKGSATIGDYQNAEERMADRQRLRCRRVYLPRADHCDTAF